MISNPLIFVGTSDIAGKTRGKAFALTDLEKRQNNVVGWTHTNVQITCFNLIAETPFGSFGDLLLVPDPATSVTVDYEDGSPIERFMLGDITDLDGHPWQCCTRAILKAALARLKAVGGVELVSAFEHEFQFKGDSTLPGDGYTMTGFTQQRGFAEALMAALEQAGLSPDTFMKEYGVNQYEITHKPSQGHRAADNAVILRELTRMTAQRCGQEVTFCPILDPASVGNGVHIHMSFMDQQGQPATYDANGQGGMSALTGSFVAGVLKYLDSILALTAPSDISYLRLTPHRWSASYNNLGLRDREAAVRICPVTASNPDSIARQYNIEFRAADAAASPYLALAALVHAGAQGIEEQLAPPPVTEEDLSLLSAAELIARGYKRLPQSLPEALECFKNNQLVTRWFPEGFADVYLAHKQGELQHLGKASPEERCAAYAAVY